MMSKTHLAVGVAAALAACWPNDLSGVLAAVLGGAAGGALCDVECHSFSPNKDTVQGRVLACGVAAAALAADYFTQRGLWNSILSQPVHSLFLGAAILSLSCLIGHFSPHRTFTHSAFFLLLIYAGFARLSPLLSGPALMGGLSHVALDLLNHKPVCFLYPILKKGVCLHLCAADKAANRFFLWAGALASAALIAQRLIAVR